MTDGARPGGVGAPGAGDILQHLLGGVARTKAELVELSGLARSTVSARVDALIATGLIAPAGEAASTGGRPPSRVAFRPLAGLVLAVDLGAAHLTVALVDLGARVRASSTHAVDIAGGPEPVLDTIISEARALLSSSAVPEGAALVGVGVGVPAPVEHSTGRPYNPPIMPGWDRFDVTGYLRAVFDVPVLVDNDVNILALGEQSISWPHVSDLVFIKVATGIGAGIISGGQLQRGAQGSAGDIGHAQVPFDPDSTRDPADQRDLEALAAGPSIARKLREAGVEARTGADVVDLVRAGNAEAIAATRQAGRDVGEVLATMVSILNPSIIVLGGSVARAGEHLLAGVREVVYRRSIPLATQHLAIVQSQAGETGGVVGAAIMVIQHVLSPEGVDARILAESR
jgi:predicted NBD/HSP70 family sugar kinase